MQNDAVALSHPNHDYCRARERVRGASPNDGVALKYYVDRIDADHIEGWCFDPLVPERVIAATLLAAGEEVYSVEAAEVRPDVGDFFGTHGKHGFRLPHGGGLYDRAAEMVLRLHAEDSEVLDVPMADLLADEWVAPWMRAVPYIRAGSGPVWIVTDGPHALSGLLGPEDRERITYRIARELAEAPSTMFEPKPQIICIPSVAGVSALPPALLVRLMSSLRPGGALFVEGLVVSEHAHAPEMGLHLRRLEHGHDWVPTMRGLRDMMLGDYVVRYVAPSRRIPSVGQYHLLKVVPRDREVFLVSGVTGAGKSSFARGILESGDQLINLDVLVGSLRSLARAGGVQAGPLCDALLRDGFSLPSFYQEIDADDGGTNDAVDELAGFLCAAVFEGAGRVVVEGVAVGEKLCGTLRARLGEQVRLVLIDLRSG